PPSPPAPCPSSRTPRTTSSNVILSTPATSGASYSSNRGTSDDHERRGGRTYHPSDADLHHAMGRDPRFRAKRYPTPSCRRQLSVVQLTRAIRGDRHARSIGGHEC